MSASSTDRWSLGAGLMMLKQRGGREGGRGAVGESSCVQVRVWLTSPWPAAVLMRTLSGRTSCRAHARDEHPDPGARLSNRPTGPLPCAPLLHQHPAISGRGRSQKCPPTHSPCPESRGAPSPPSLSSGHLFIYLSIYISIYLFIYLFKV